MSNTHSRRWIETDKHIRQTALELLNRPEAHNLSVRLICEEAGINRTTFYEHYLDIYDLLDKLELDVMAELWDYYVQMIDRSNHLPPQPFLPLLAHIRANQDFYKNVLKTRETCRLKPVFERFLTEAVCAACRKAGVSDEKEITYYLVFFKAGFKNCHCSEDCTCSNAADHDLARSTRIRLNGYLGFSHKKYTSFLPDFTVGPWNHTGSTSF